MLGKIVDVIIDRPLGSTHPEHKDILYTVNYGYIPKTISPVDGEEIDAYVVDVDIPINKYKGRVIGIIHRENEEDKLIVANCFLSEEEIRNKVWFMEQYFKSWIEVLGENHESNKKTK